MSISYKYEVLISLATAIVIIISLLVYLFFVIQWDPPALEQVSGDMIDNYFSPLSDLEPDLELPTEKREAFT